MLNQTRLEQINAQLAASPYQFNLLAEKFLTAYTLKCLPESAQALRAIQAMPGGNSVTTLILQLNDKLRTLVHRQGIWFVFPTDANEAMQDYVIETTTSHLMYYREIDNGLAQTLIIIEMAALAYSFCNSESQGIVHIGISGAEQSTQELSAALAHELAHANWPCKNRLIAEGIALVLENQRQSTAALIKSPKQAKLLFEKHVFEIPSFSALLSNPYAGTVLLAHDSDVPEYLAAIYAVAFILVSELIEHRGLSVLRQLTQQLNQTSDGQAETIFTEILGRRSTLAVRLDQRAAKELDLDEIDKAIIIDRRSLTSKSFDQYYQALANNHDALHSVSVNVLLGRLLKVKLVEVILVNKQKSPLLDELNLVCRRLQDIGARYHSAYFDAVSGGFQLSLSHSGIEKAILGSRIRENFKLAIDKLNDFTEVKIDAALCELYVPVHYGQKSHLARKLLNAAADNPVYVQEVKGIEQYFNLSQVG